MGVRGRVPNGRKTGAFKAGAGLKSSANEDSPWAGREEPRKRVHPSSSLALLSFLPECPIVWRVGGNRS